MATCLTGCAARKSQPAPAAHVQSASIEARGEALAEAPPQAAPPDQQSVGWTTTPLAVASEPVAVKQGPAPLFYLVESPGTFRVFDRTAGQDLARAAAPGRSIVRVDGRTGVVVADETLVAGPLPRDHQYVIYRDPTGPNMVRQGTFQLMPHRTGAAGHPQGRTPGAAPTAAPGGAADRRQSDSQSGGRELEGGPDVSH